MKKRRSSPGNSAGTKKGYNEHNPGQPHGAFPPASNDQEPTEKIKSNTADKKEKENVSQPPRKHGNI